MCPTAQDLTKQVRFVAVQVSQASCHLKQSPLPGRSIFCKLRQGIYG